MLTTKYKNQLDLFDNVEELLAKHGDYLQRLSCGYTQRNKDPSKILAR